MRITFVLSSLTLSGGTKAVFEFANKLHSQGHLVTVVYSLIDPHPTLKGYTWKSLFKKLITMGRALTSGPRVDWFDLKTRLICARHLSDEYIPDADIVVATWWRTVDPVMRLSATKGKKIYLAQHYEVWGGPKDQVDKSYLSGIPIVVHSNWLKNILCDNLGVKTDLLVVHAPDHDHFFPEPVKIDTGHINLLMPYRRLEWKGVKDGIQAFEIAKQTCPNITLSMYGPRRGPDIPSYVKFHERPSNDELRKLYNTADIFIFPSHIEGFGMPPMEAMACTCPVVSTDVGAVSEYTLNGKFALLSPPKKPNMLAENIVKLVQDEHLRNELAEKAYKNILTFTWENSAKALEKIFVDILNKEKAQPNI